MNPTPFEGTDGRGSRIHAQDLTGRHIGSFIRFSTVWSEGSQIPITAAAELRQVRHSPSGVVIFVVNPGQPDSDHSRFELDPESPVIFLESL